MLEEENCLSDFGDTQLVEADICLFECLLIKQAVCPQYLNITDLLELLNY